MLDANLLHMQIHIIYYLYMDAEAQFKALLRSNGERVTTARLSVYRALNRYSPLTTAKLIDKVKEDGVDPVTCYRTLDLYRKLEMVQDVGLGRNRMLELIGGPLPHHHHLWCKVCGQVTTFDSAIIEQELSKISERLGIAIDSHQLEAHGTCSGCMVKTS